MICSFRIRFLSHYPKIKNGRRLGLGSGLVLAGLLLIKRRRAKGRNEHEVDENLVERHIRYPNLTCFAFLLRGFISGKRVPVYPVWGVFLVEIRGKNEELYALEAKKFPLSRWERAARQPAGWRAG